MWRNDDVDTFEGLRELSLFAGAGGGLLASRELGWRTVCAVELDPYCQRVLCERQNDQTFEPFPIWDDIRSFDGKPWRGLVDIVSGGFPCQDISTAGKGAGITGEKSGLWKEMARVIGEVRPQFAWIENSPALVSRGLDTVLGDLAALGYDARWGVVSACAVGAPHTRERLFVYAYSNGERLFRSILECKENERKKSILSSLLAPQKNGAQGMEDDLSESLLHGKNHGVAHRIHRTRAIGNGQVPQAVMLAWKWLSENM